MPAPYIDVTVRYVANKDLVVVRPARAVVSNTNQVVRWRTQEKEIEIAFDPKRPINGAAIKYGSGTCELGNIPKTKENHGEHKYTATLTLQNGKKKSRDPDVIVNY